MEEKIYYSALYDYYASLLTDVQQTYFEEYYFNNLSLTEIAANFNISKNAISKTLKEVINKLLFYEDHLKLYANCQEISKILDKKELQKIEAYI